MSLRNRIEEVLRDHSDGLTASELGEKLNWDARDLDASLTRMSYKNKVLKDKDGKWRMKE